jgi:hypothetical protein
MNMNGVQRFLSRREKKAKPNGEVVSTLKHLFPTLVFYHIPYHSRYCDRRVLEQYNNHICYWASLLVTAT